MTLGLYEHAGGYGQRENEEPEVNIPLRTRQNFDLMAIIDQVMDGLARFLEENPAAEKPKKPL
jgi:hypothetical protein